MLTLVCAQTMCSLFDCLWWWRQEFRGQPDPFRVQTGTVNPPERGNNMLPPSLPSDDTIWAFPDYFTLDENYFTMHSGYYDGLMNT